MNQLLDMNLDVAQKRRFYNVVITTIVILAIFLGVQVINAVKEYSYIGMDPATTNVINVMGTGEVLAVPDIATFSFSVNESAKTVGDAQKLSATKTNAILDALKKMGIADKDIQTTGYNSYPKYDYSSSVCPQNYGTSGGAPSVAIYCPPGKQVLTGYEVDETITVKVRKTADAGTALTTIGELGATNISGLNFIVDNIDTVNIEARDKAITDAKTKADVLAKSLGIKLVKIVNFSESGNQPPIYFGMASAKAMSADSVPVVPDIQVGQNTVTSNVTITYQIQ